MNLEHIFEINELYTLIVNKLSFINKINLNRTSNIFYKRNDKLLCSKKYREDYDYQCIPGSNLIKYNFSLKKLVLYFNEKICDHLNLSQLKVDELILEGSTNCYPKIFFPSTLHKLKAVTYPNKINEIKCDIATFKYLNKYLINVCTTATVYHEYSSATFYKKKPIKMRLYETDLLNYINKNYNFDFLNELEISDFLISEYYELVQKLIMKVTNKLSIFHNYTKLTKTSIYVNSNLKNLNMECVHKNLLKINGSNNIHIMFKMNMYIPDTLELEERNKLVYTELNRDNKYIHLESEYNYLYINTTDYKLKTDNAITTITYLRSSIHAYTHLTNQNIKINRYQPVFDRILNNNEVINTYIEDMYLNCLDELFGNVFHNVDILRINYILDPIVIEKDNKIYSKSSDNYIIAKMLIISSIHNINKITNKSDNIIIKYLL